MVRMLALAAIATVSILFVALLTSGFPGFWLSVPIAVVVGIVVARRTSPIKAGLIGTAATFGIVVGIILPVISIKALKGGWESPANCDGFCFTNGEGFVFALMIMMFVAVPTSLASGVVSFFASLVTPGTRDVGQAPGRRAG